MSRREEAEAIRDVVHQHRVRVPAGAAIVRQAIEDVLAGGRPRW